MPYASLTLSQSVLFALSGCLTHTRRATVPACCPTFGFHVEHIVVVRSKKMMGRIDATPVVAGMTDEETVRDRPVRQLPGHTMRASMLSMRFAKQSVPACSECSCPDPACISLADFRPKPNSKRPSACEAFAGEAAIQARIFFEGRRINKERLAALFADAGNGRITWHHKISFCGVAPWRSYTPFRALLCPQLYHRGYT